MATLTFSDDIPNRTALIKLIADAELESYFLNETTGFFTYDTDQVVEADESDLIINVEGEGMADQPFPQGTISGFTVSNLDTGLLWATVADLPDLDVTQLIILAADPTTTVTDYGNFFFGGGDTVTGGASKNIIYGFNGNDHISGGAGNDKLSGRRGADFISGGEGRDIIAGNSGADTIVFLGTALTNKNADTLVNFNTARDTILLGFTGIGDTLDDGEFTVGEVAGAAEHRIVYDDLTGRIYFDADGSGAIAQRLFATIDPGADLSASNFDMII